MDRPGDAYVTGVTSSAFPTTAGAFQTTGRIRSNNAFVAKLKPDGWALTYGSYLGSTAYSGGGAVQGNGVAVDSSGQATVVGFTAASNFPTTSGAPQTSYGGNTDAFAVQFNPAGSALNFGTYLGGSGTDEATGVALDALGYAYLVGFTNSSNFPTSSGAYPDRPGHRRLRRLRHQAGAGRRPRRSSPGSAPTPAATATTGSPTRATSASTARPPPTPP